MSAGEVDSLVMVVAAVAIGLTGLMVAFKVPSLAIIGWISVIAFVPIWWGVDLVAYVYPGTIAGVGALVVLLRRPSFGRITAGDVGILIFFIATLSPILVKGAWAPAAMFAVVTQWLLAYLIGRLALSVISAERLYGVIGVVFGIVAVLAIIESIFHYNPFIAFGGHGPLFDSWRAVQSRGGLPRAEGAWGHSIALGAALAMSIPLMLASRLKPGLKVALVLIMLGGVVVTLSRIGQLTAVLALVLSLYAMAPIMKRGLKAATLMILFVGGLMGYSYVTGVFDSSGDEFSKSAAYRGDLLSLVHDIAAFGLSPVISRDATGAVNFDGFESIDNAMLLLGLKHGWFALGVALALGAAVLVMVVLRKAEPPTISVATQIPALFAVALITQFSMYFWFMVGLAVAVHAHKAVTRRKEALEVSAEEFAAATSQPPPRSLISV